MISFLSLIILLHVILSSVSLFHYLLKYFLYDMCAGDGRDVRALTCTWRLEHNFQELILSLHLVFQELDPRHQASIAGDFTQWPISLVHPLWLLGTPWCRANLNNLGLFPYFSVVTFIPSGMQWYRFQGLEHGHLLGSIFVPGTRLVRACIPISFVKASATHILAMLGLHGSPCLLLIWWRVRLHLRSVFSLVF